MDDLQTLGAVVAVRESQVRSRPYVLRVAEDGHRILVEVEERILHPKVSLAGAQYALRIVEGRTTDPPLILRNRPREIVFNLSHDVFGGCVRRGVMEMVMALEFSFLTAPTRSDEDLYDAILTLLSGS